MYRIRLHGRGGHGIKTGSRILGTALFLAGFEVQDAPRYGAERRGAPMSGTVRASRRPIHERGVIVRPDLVVVTDETLFPVASAGVLTGVGPATTLLLMSDADAATWRARLATSARVVVLPPAAEEPRELPFLGATMAGAAARLLGVIERSLLDEAIASEVAAAGEPGAVDENLARAHEAWAWCDAEPVVGEGPDDETDAAGRPAWIELGPESLPGAAPGILGGPTSERVQTGAWRTMRPVVDETHCRHCTWICSTFCPDAAISAGPDGVPEFDLDHCKGCLVCVAVCPSHAIHAVPERGADAAPEQDERREGR